MRELQDGILAFFAAVGLCSVVWLAAGALFQAGRVRVPGLLLVLPVRGAAPALEHDVRELRRVLHQLPGARLILADRGLTPDARALAEYLAAREEGAEVREGPELTMDDAGL